MIAYELLLKAETDEQLAELRGMLVEGGYSSFYRFLDQIKMTIKSFADGEEDEVFALITRARQAVPEPGSISPSWTYIWDKLEQITRNKLHALQSVPSAVRDGEWQVLIDNPFVNREVACYPGLNFTDAVYIYAQFRYELEQNEYIRLQKIVTHLTEFGSPPE